MNLVAVFTLLKLRSPLTADQKGVVYVTLHFAAFGSPN